MRQDICALRCSDTFRLKTGNIINLEPKFRFGRNTIVICVVFNRFISPIRFIKGIVLCNFELWVNSCKDSQNPMVGKCRVPKAISWTWSNTLFSAKRAISCLQHGTLGNLPGSPKSGKVENVKHPAANCRRVQKKYSHLFFAFILFLFCSTDLWQTAQIVEQQVRWFAFLSLPWGSSLVAL